MQKFCTTTSTVTGWINAFHHWHYSGSLLASESREQGEAVPAPGEQLTLDDITYSWRHISALQAPYNTFPLCVVGATGGGRFEIMAGMLAVSVKDGAPNGYATALQAANVSHSTTLQSSDHGTYLPFPFYSIYNDRTVTVSTIFHCRDYT
jgi:hypothetical protein